METHNFCFLRKALLPAVFTLLIPAYFYGQVTATDNLQQIRTVLIAPSLQVLTSGEFPNTVIIGAKKPGSDIERWIVQNLTDSCLARNYLVYSSRENAPEEAAEIRIADVSAEIAYRTGDRNWLGRKASTIRTVTASMHLSILDNQQQVLYSREIGGQLTDKISGGKNAHLENPKYLFSRGKWPSAGSYSKWAEPLLVGAATATVVALFYRLRSN